MGGRRFIRPIGAELYSPITREHVETSSALTGKIIMIYFSAHWCPPCRQFTPKLVDLYNAMKSNGRNDFEVVFISLDRNESEYNNYVEGMPWMCVPFEQAQKKKDRLKQKYNVRGIPSLVIVDANDDRDVITVQGRASVQADPVGGNFPWRPKGFEEIWPVRVLTKTGTVASSTFDGKYLMLYFSAHWCPPCRAFTPQLSTAYETMKEDRDDFEVVFVSSDRDEKGFKDYYNDMPFFALPFEDRAAKQELSNLFQVRGIPTLLILGPVPEGGGNRPLINENLRAIISSGNFDDFPFHPKGKTKPNSQQQKKRGGERRKNKNRGGEND